MKYVMFTNVNTGLQMPVLFAESFSHVSVAVDPGWIATSAGFFVALPKLKVHGKSDSLQLWSLDSDLEIIKYMMAEVLGAMAHLTQDTEAALGRLHNFCLCGHNVSAHRIVVGTEKRCAIIGCECKGFGPIRIKA